MSYGILQKTSRGQPALAVLLACALGLFACSDDVQSKADPPVFQRGKASYYAGDFDGQRTASGQHYNEHALTAAHRTLPLGTQVKVTDLDNHRSVTVRINDRGPYQSNRIIDLSYRAAQHLHMVHSGIAPVALRVLNRP